MNKKKLGLGLFALAFGFLAITGCKKKEQEPTEPAFVAAHISDVLGYANNASVMTEGVVFQTTTEGYYLNDTTGSIYVKDGTNAVTVGDKVQLTSTYRLLANQPTIVVNKTADKFTKVTSGETALAPTTSSVAEICALENTVKTNYAKYLTVEGTITDNDGLGYYTITDINNNKVYLTKGDSTVATFVGKRVEISVVTAKYDTASSMWTVTFGGSNKVTTKELVVSDVKELIKEDLDKIMPTNELGNFGVTLPVAYDIYGATVTWESDNAAIAVSEAGKVTVDYLVAEDTACKLTATIHVGETSDTLEYTVTAKQIVLDTLKNVSTNFENYTNYDFVKFTGIVVAKVENQSGSSNGLILANSLDATDKEYRLQYDLPKACAEYTDTEVGDTVTVYGQVRNTQYDRYTVLGYTGTTVFGFVKETVAKETVTYTEDDVVLVVDSAEDLAELALNWNKKYVGRLIKIVNPYAMWTITQESARTSQTAICLTFGATTYAEASCMQMNGITKAAAGDTILANRLSIISAYNDAVLGTNIWHNPDLFDIAYRTDGNTATEYKATIYAIPTFFKETGDGATILCIPSMDCFVPSEEATAMTIALGSVVPTSIDKEEIELPATYKDQDITWSVLAGQEAFVTFAAPVDGKVVATIVRSETENINVTFKATVGEAEAEFNSVLLKNAPLEISELAAMEAGNGLNVQGYVIGVVTGHGGSAASNGILISDGTKTMMINTCAGLTCGAKETIDQETWKLHDVTIKVGDYIKFTGAAVLVAGQKFSAKTATVVTESHMALDASFNKQAEEDMIVIDSDADMNAYLSQFKAGEAAGANYSQLVKVVGTVENPVYVAANNTSYIMCLFFPETAPTGAVTTIRDYDVQNAGDGKLGAFLVKPLNAVNTYGMDWLQLNTPVTGFNYSEGNKYYTSMTKISDDNPAIPLVGELYFYYEYVGSATYPYVYMIPVFGTNGTVATTMEAKAEAIVQTAFKNEVMAGADYEVNAITNGCITNVVITSDNEIVLAPSMTEAVKAGTVNANTDVTLTVTYKLNGVDKSTTVTVTVKPSKVVTYVKLTDATKLKIGDKFVLTNKDNTKIAYADQSMSEVTVTDGVIANSAVTDDVVIFELIKGSKDGTFGIKCLNGSNAGKVVLTKDASSGSTSNNIAPGYQNSATDNASFSFEYDATAGAMIIYATNSAKTHKWLNSYTSNSNTKWSLCKNESKGLNVYLYTETDL